MSDKTPLTKLRQQAEARFAENTNQPMTGAVPLSPEAAQQLVHELQVHQIELETQNEELREAQANLDTARAYYFNLYDLSPVGYLTISMEGLIMDGNLTSCTMLGVPRAKLEKQLFSNFILKEDQDVFYLHRKQLLETTQHQACELRMLNNHSTPVWVNMYISIVEKLDGVSIFRLILTDISKRKQTEAELRIIATAFDSQESLMITDATGVILRVNKAFTKATGYTAEDAVGRTPKVLKSGRHDADFYAKMWESISRTGAWKGEIWDRQKDGTVCPKFLTISAVRNDDGNITNYVGSHVDITERKAAEEEIKSLAFYDPLTSLPNRRLLLERLEQALFSSKRSGQEGALLFLDLDDFKRLNDTRGHDIGDMLLKQVGQRLLSCVREADTVARLGGDEFVVLLEDLSNQPIEAAAQTKGVGEKILAVLGKPYLLGSKEYSSTPSIGVALFNSRKQGVEDLFKQADIAMYQAKKSGRNTLRFFDPQMQKAINDRSVLEGELIKAIELKQFDLYYQIQVDNEQRPIGAEALVRWIHPTRGIVSPEQFIALTEESTLILEVGDWVMDAACRQLSAWSKAEHTRHLTLAVNVSPKHFQQGDFVAKVLESLKFHNINPMLLKLELTESMLHENIEKTIDKMVVLNEGGIKFALDDFGTGYSSLQYLKKLPLDELKIDQSFVRDIATDKDDRAIVAAIISMANHMGIGIIAEGVETEDQLQFLLSSGCAHFQGYLFGKPISPEQFDAHLKSLQ